MARVLILGVNGQDGSYLAEILSRQGHVVDGVGRTAERCHWLEECRMRYHCLDVGNSAALSRLLEFVQPEHVYHMAAVHGPAGFVYESCFPEAMSVNALSLHPILEYARNNPHTRLLYASSSKIFGTPLPEVVCENSARLGTCLYSVTKLAAEGLIRHYREKFGVQANIVYLFNHESLRRSEKFFFPLLINGLSKSLCGGHTMRVRTLDFCCDWGSAEEYMRLCTQVLECAPGQDIVLATGHTVHARDLAARLCEHFSLDMRCCIEETQKADPCLLTTYAVDISRLKSLTGAAPSLMAFELGTQLINEICMKKVRND